VLEGLRTEFPSLARWSANLRPPALARESIGWAFVSGLGAGFIAEGLVRVLLLVLGPALFPATQPHPEWLTPFAITSVVGGIATGAVLARAGGVIAFLLFVAFELAQIIAAFPSRQQFCANLQPAAGLNISCDLPTIVLQRWPEWAALVLGALVARAVFRSSGPGANWMLRASGAWVLVSTIVGTTLGLTIRTPTVDAQSALNALFTVGQLLAGATAGIIAARTRRAAAAVLIALLILGPVLAYALPQAVVSSPLISDPVSRFALWLGVTSPLVAAVSLLVARAFVLRRMRTAPGTFS
jgi:hypothetical protein